MKNVADIDLGTSVLFRRRRNIRFSHDDASQSDDTFNRVYSSFGDKISYGSLPSEDIKDFGSSKVTEINLENSHDVSTYYDFEFNVISAH